MTEEEKEELLLENEYLKSVIEKYKERESEIEKKEKNAERRAEEIMAAAKKAFGYEIDRLRLFRARWEKTFGSSALSEEEKAEIRSLTSALSEIFEGKGENADLSRSERADKAAALLGEKSLSRVYIGDRENGFSLGDVEDVEGLDLEELCKELGLTEN